MLGSETRMSFPPVPPSPPPPPEKRYVAVIAVAIAAGILVVGSLMLFVGTAPGDAEPNVAADADAVESDAAPSPPVVTTPGVGTSPGPVSDPGRISAIVADAHSGKYFSNTFEDSYPKAAERRPSICSAACCSTASGSGDKSGRDCPGGRSCGSFICTSSASASSTARPGGTSGCLWLATST